MGWVKGVARLSLTSGIARAVKPTGARSARGGGGGARSARGGAPSDRDGMRSDRGGARSECGGARREAGQRRSAADWSRSAADGVRSAGGAVAFIAIHHGFANARGASENGARPLGLRRGTPERRAAAQEERAWTSERGRAALGEHRLPPE
jgi:hypothetical protein